MSSFDGTLKVANLSYFCIFGINAFSLNEWLVVGFRYWNIADVDWSFSWVLVKFDFNSINSSTMSFAKRSEANVWRSQIHHNFNLTADINIELLRVWYLKNSLTTSDSYQSASYLASPNHLLRFASQMTLLMNLSNSYLLISVCRICGMDEDALSLSEESAITCVYGR